MKTPGKIPKVQAMLYAFANWFVPGLGYLLVKDFRRGIPLLIIINGLFLIGLSYNGYVYWATFNPQSPEFNIVASLTMIAQMCHGLGAGLLLMLQQGGQEGFNLLLRDPGTAYSDVGAFHILVVGVLNYFATTRLYDDLTGYVNPEAEAKKKGKEGGGNSEKSETEESGNTTASTSDDTDLSSREVAS